MKNLILFLVLSSFVFSSCKVFHETKTEHTKYDLTEKNNADSDAEINKLISPYKKELDAKMNEVIGTAEKELVKALPECTLGNWAADAILAQCNKTADQPIDFAVVNYGGIRIPTLPKGEITLGKIYELMPFDNMMVILEVDGKIVQQLFENIAGRGGWPVSKGVVCNFNADGELLDVRINDKKIDSSKIYRIGITDYVANGGDKCSFFKGQKQIDTGILFREAFINQVVDQTKNGTLINAEIDGRMILE